MLALSFLQGLVLTLTPFVFFPVCQDFAPDGSRMHCFYSGVFITITGILIMLCIASSFLGMLRNLSLIAASIMAFMCWVIPNEFLGLCGNPEHPCRASTMPHVGVFSAVIIVLAVVCMTFNFINGKGK